MTVSTMNPILCMACTRLDTSTGEPGVCRAFPEGIPDEILAGGDHHQPRGGEVDGLLFESTGTQAAGVVLSMWRERTAAQNDDQLTAAADVSNGAMVAYLPAAEDAHRLALLDPDAEPVDQLHVTSIYLGDATDWDAADREQLIDTVTELTRGWAPIAAQAFGLSMLNPTGEEPCLVLNIGGQELADRQAELTALDISAPDQHAPWLAHLTLAYHPDPRTLLTDEVLARTGPVQLDRIRVAFAGNYTDIPLVTGLTADAFRTYARDAKGRFGSGGGMEVRPELDSATSTDEVSTAFRGEFQRVTGRDIPADFGGMDVDRAKQHAEGVLRVTERYPQNGLQEIRTYDPQHMPAGVPRDYQGAYAFTHHPDGANSTIYFNTGWSEHGIRDSLGKDEAAGRLASPTLMGIGAHEMGHVVTVDQGPRMQGYIAMLSLNTRRNETPQKFVGRTISEYASDSAGELCGEAMADVIVNGGGASDVSKAVVAAIDANVPGAQP